MLRRDGQPRDVMPRLLHRRDGHIGRLDRVRAADHLVRVPGQDQPFGIEGRLLDDTLDEIRFGDGRPMTMPGEDAVEKRDQSGQIRGLEG